MTTNTIPAQADLEGMKLAELVDIYNGVAEKAVKSFRSKKQAIQALLGLSNEAPSAEDTNVRVRKPFMRDADTSVETPKVARAGSKRALIVEMMQRPEGATFEEMRNREEVQWNEQTAREGITLVHKQLGWGLHTDAEGRIRVWHPGTEWAQPSDN